MPQRGRRQQKPSPQQEHHGRLRTAEGSPVLPKTVGPRLRIVSAVATGTSRGG
jgi:hypothetical protein